MLSPIIPILLLTLLSLQPAQSSRKNTTDFYASLLPSKSISYECHTGYEDIDWFMSGQQASVFYSAWECSTRKFTDHSTPVIFYLNGGPGLSSQFAAMRQFGPIEIVYDNGQYKAVENPWSWNYYAHLIFVDMPVGTGFSYNKLKTVDTSKLVAQHFLNFLRNFLRNFPFGLSANPLYIAGQGFAAQYISIINELLPVYNNFTAKIQGYIIGGPMINAQKQINFYESILSAAAIVEPKIRNLTNSICSDAIVKIRNGKFAEGKAVVDQFLREAPQKYYNGISINNFKKYSDSSQGKSYIDFLNTYKDQFGIPDNVAFIQQNPDIFLAMSADTYKSHLKQFQTVLASQKRVLIYSGQNDLITSPASVLSIIQDVQWKGDRDWKETRKSVWKEGGKIAGWVKKNGNVIYVTVKGAGHYIYEDESISDKEMYLMLNNFFNRKW